LGFVTASRADLTCCCISQEGNVGKTFDNVAGIFIDDNALNYACVNKPLEKN
jgi:hypothetical protein